MTLYQFLS